MPARPHPVQAGLWGMGGSLADPEGPGLEPDTMNPHPYSGDTVTSLVWTVWEAHGVWFCRRFQVDSLLG